MADLRSRFIEDYAGGLLNVARQELSTTGEVLAQDGFTSEGTLFVEDGSGVKSGLKLGVSLVEVVDPTTLTGAVNVRYANRAYAQLKDLKIFSTAVASAQAALSQATSKSITNLETTLQLLEDNLETLEQNLQTNLVSSQQQLQSYSLFQQSIEDIVNEQQLAITSISARVSSLEAPANPPRVIAPISEVLNTSYFSGTIGVTNSQVVGVGTSFSEELEIGSVFVAITDTGEEVEFTVTSFDSDTPDTSITVTPTNKTITAPAVFRRPRLLNTEKKLNELLTELRRLQLIA